GKAMMLVCDASGRVQAVTSKGGVETFGGVSGARDFADIFGRDSTINNWFTERVQEAREQNEYYAEAILDLGNGSGQVFAKLESLTCDDELYGFALQLCP